MANFVFIAKVEGINNDFTTKSGKTVKAADKNGMQNMVMRPYDGIMPNRAIVNGTIAHQLGLISGKTYALQYAETDANEFGRQFQLNVVGEVPVLEAYQLAKSGSVKIVDVNVADELKELVADAAEGSSLAQ